MVNINTVLLRVVKTENREEYKKCTDFSFELKVVANRKSIHHMQNVMLHTMTCKVNNLCVGSCQNMNDYFHCFTEYEYNSIVKCLNIH